MSQLDLAELSRIPEELVSRWSSLGRAAHGVEGWHVTPGRVLRANGALACANLLKPEHLEKQSRRSVAVRQPQVSAGELVDFYSPPVSLGF